MIKNRFTDEKADISLLAKLCDANGPSGYEDEIRDIIIAEISPYVNKLKIDKMGNLIAFKKGGSPLPRPLMFDAHMDEVGFMITRVTDEGYLKFGTVGGIDPGILAAKRVTVGKNALPGVIASKAVHMMSREDKAAPVKLSGLFCDIGARSREEALEHVSVGDYICFDSKLCRMGCEDSYVKAKALDDRLGCWLLINMIKSDLEYDTYFSFSVQEEPGCRGAKVSAFGIDPYIGVAIDATTAGDVDGVTGMNTVCSQGKGGVISLADGACVYDKALFDMITSAAAENGIKVQPKLRATGGNNASSLQRAASGARVCALSAPARYIHSPSSTVKISDMTEMQNLLLLMVGVFGRETIEKN